MLRSQSLVWHGHLRLRCQRSTKAASFLEVNFVSSIIRENIQKQRRNCKWRRCSLEKEKEIDTAKAREALKQLDQKLQSISEAPPPIPTKTKLPLSDTELELDKNFRMRGDFREDMPEISDSYLAYTAGALVLLTIFTNIVFSFFIKPSIDGYQTPIPIERVPLSEPE